jgi:SPP1 family phage portal protein
MAGVVNMADENFAQNASGVAIKYKLQGMEYQASRIDSYFDKGIKRRFEIIRAILSIDPKVSNAHDYRVIIKHDRTLPPDLITLAQATRGLIGTISQESILKLFPKTVVADIEKEKQLLAEETGAFGVENG